MQTKTKKTNIRKAPAMIYIPASSDPSLRSEETQTKVINDNEWIDILRFELDTLHSRFLLQAKACGSMSSLLDKIEISNTSGRLAELSKLIYNECARLQRDDEMAGDTYEDEIKWVEQVLKKVIKHKSGRLKMSIS